MKIILISIGTRGDIEPFVAIAEQLVQRRHSVICAFPAQFERIVDEIGAEFFPLKKEFLDMLESENGRTALGGGGSFFTRFKAMFRLYQMNRIVSYEMFLQQHELITENDPDLVIHSLKAMYPVYWHFRNPGKVIQVSPIPCVIHPREDMSSIFLNGKDYGKRLNTWSYRFSRRLSMAYTQRQIRRAGIDNISTGQMVKSLTDEKFIYTISPNLLSANPEWPEQVKVFGYQERDKQRSWTPAPELMEFLKVNPNPLFITFGSMTNPDPIGKTKLVLDSLKDLNLAAIINTAAGGLVKSHNHDPRIHFVNDIPYDWIFPKVRAVIHHGGAGTTHLAIKYGRPSMIIPHIPDQYLWNRIISRLGAGPEGPSIRKLNRNNFTNKVAELASGTYDNTAMELGNLLSAEDYTENLLKFIEN